MFISTNTNKKISLIFNMIATGRVHTCSDFCNIVSNGASYLLCKYAKTTLNKNLFNTEQPLRLNIDDKQTAKIVT